jgi:hypothetical protein
MSYKIVKDICGDRLSAIISDYMKKGWEPLGCCQITSKDGYHMQFVQTIIKRRTNETIN